MFSGFGNRFLLLKYVENSPDEVFDDDEHVTTVTEQEAFSLITAALERPWEFTIEDGVVDALKTFAIQSTRIRSMMWGETAHDIEKPHRLFNQLKNLMKSRARLYNRTVVTMADFEFVKPLIWLTLPYSNALMHLTEGLVSNRIPRKYKDMCRNGKKLGILVRSDIDGYMIENQKPEQYTFSEAYREIMEEFTAYMTNLGYTLTTLEDDE